LGLVVYANWSASVLFIKATMKNKFANRVQHIAGAGAAAWDVHYQALRDQEHDNEVIVLSVGDPDFSTPREITLTAINALKQGDNHYTPILGRNKLRQSIAREFNRCNLTQVSLENVAILAGAQNALFAASLCILNPGDEVLVFDPMYLTYEAFIGVSGARVTRVEGTSSDGYRPNIARLKQAISPSTKAIAFSNPNNPSGVVMTAEEIAEVAAIAIDNDLWVIADEVYATLTFEHAHTSIATIEGMQERTISVNSLSKSHAMTGWRLGWMIAPKELIRHIENLALCMLYGLPGFVQEAGVEALNGSLKQSEKMRDVYKARRDLVCQFLASIEELKVMSPDAGMFVLVDVSRTGMKAAEFTNNLYTEQKVAVLDGSAFGNSTSDCIRISFTNGDAVLLQACERIRLFISQL